ncbi:PadR family transcriptional regulator [Methylobacterium sp. Leaf399]|uniref:PadR family transcriptional regulator n=1 Tax=Methylobacterium sp. Leaf399 TaxID=1736364 RepID=UPI0009EA3421|nr:helix-turn-helix transcriptional regulator [Methylobacterium sp. Leaf399]
MTDGRRPVFPPSPTCADRIVRHLAEQRYRAPSGASISKASGIGAGRLYPALADLEKRELVRSRWDVAAAPGGPRPRLYALTDLGARHARSLPPPIPQNPSPWARLGRLLFDLFTRR